MGQSEREIKLLNVDVMKIKNTLHEKGIEPKGKYIQDVYTYDLLTVDGFYKKYIDEMYFEELILRYFSIIFGDLNIDKNIPEYLSRFMQKVTKNEINISINDEKNKLLRIIEFLNIIQLVKIT